MTFLLSLRIQPGSVNYHHVSSSIWLYIFRELRDDICSCFEGVQKADEDRYCLPSPRHPVAIVRLFQCYHRHAQNPSTDYS